MAVNLRCVWCGTANPFTDLAEPPTICTGCGLNPMPGEDPTKGGKIDPAKARATKRSKRSAPIRRKLGTEPVGQPAMGVDPGARYTGVVIRDGDVALHATTLVRGADTTATGWAIQVVAEITTILAEYPPGLPVGVEGINDPKGFQHGKRASLNPRDIIRAGIVLGAVAVTWPNAPIIPPGGNGSQHYSHYPPELIGRRPATLPGSTNGAGTRDHEQSAYDVAGKTAKIVYAKTRKTLFE